MIAQPNLLDPDDYGWVVRDGSIEIDWMSQQPAPAELLEFVLHAGAGPAAQADNAHAAKPADACMYNACDNSSKLHNLANGVNCE